MGQRQSISGGIVALWLGLAAVAPALADTGHGLAYADFSSTQGLALVGNAAQSGNAVRLTPATTDQRGAMWFTTQQPVAGGFSTVFSFQITNLSTPLNADGIAFVIQNAAAGTAAIGGIGEGIGYGFHAPTGEPGIPNSLAVELDTYQNGFDPNANHVAVQSCGTANNTPNHNDTSCALGINPSPGVTFADGNVHTVRIDYTQPPSPGLTSPPPNLVISIDGSQVLSIFVDLASELSLAAGGQAFVGLTAATGGSFENHDILSWTLTPFQGTSETLPLDPGGAPVDFVFGSFDKEFKNYGLGAQGIVTVETIPISPADFAAQQAGGTFPGAQCIVYDQTGGNCIIFHVSCSGASQSDCTFQYDTLAGYLTQQTIVQPGYLKDPNCGNQWTNIITDWSVNRLDPTTKSRTFGFSCFVAVTNVNDPPSITINSPANGAIYTLNQAVAADYSCASALTSVAMTTCAGPVPSGQNIDTSSYGSKSFTVNASDAVSNTSSKTSTYTVEYSTGSCLGDAGHQILQPINADGSSVFKLKSTVPAKFRVCDGSGNSVGTPGVVTSFRLIQTIQGTAVSSVNEPVSSTTPDAAFRWDPVAQQWIYNISTSSMTAGFTYVYRITLNDTSNIDFRFGLK